MVGHGGSSAGSYLADPTSPIPSHCASIVMTSTLRVIVAFSSIVESVETAGENIALTRAQTVAVPCVILC